MINKTFNAKTEYNYDLDIYSITSCENIEFGKSLEIEEGIILDFDIDNIPIAIEILDISKRLKISKNAIKSSNAHMKIKSIDDVLEVCITFFIRTEDKEFKETIDSKVINSLNIPEMVFSTV